LGFADDFYSADAFAVCFLELFNGVIENIALADVNFLFWLWLKSV
jgi:hypothetical protein